MINYSKIGTDRLNLLAAEMLGAERCTLVGGEIDGYRFPDEINEGCYSTYKEGWWNPTHPDSNQAERYLFPKLGDNIHIEFHWVNNHHVSIEVKKWCDKFQWMATGIYSESDLNKINRTKVIACLEAWEKLK